MVKIKVKTINRNPETYARETKGDLHKVYRNFDKNEHPFEAQREYARALNAVKVEKMLSKPYVSTLDGHGDGVCCIERHPTELKTIVSASFDYQFRVWDLANSKSVFQVNRAHAGVVQGMSFNPNGESLCSVALDNIIKMWSFRDGKLRMENSIVSSSILHGVHYSRASSSMFGTCGDGVHIYDVERNTPLHHFTFGGDTIKTITFNPIEANLVASAVADRSLILYDVRQSTPVARTVLAMQSNALSWNPLEAPYFVVANEDSNLYAFDVRKLETPYREYADHTNAVLDVDFSPTGQEFVSGSYDRSLRIFPFLGATQGTNCCRDVYHTKRMQRIFCVRFSGDSQYVMSGSDEMNIRLWKTTASKKLGYLRPREKRSIDYANKLAERFQHHPEIKKIKNRKHLSKFLHVESERQKTFFASQKRKQENIRLFRKQEPTKRKAVVYTYDQDDTRIE